MNEKILLKDQLLSAEKVNYLAKLIEKEYPAFNTSNFTQECTSLFPKLELKERMYRVREMLKKYIPEDYSNTLKILDKATKGDTQLLFVFMTLPDYVENYGCSKQYLDISLDYLWRFTKIGSSEFAIRDFINTFPEETYTISQAWTKSNNYHIRRFVSEGWRPKLPWAKKINFDHTLWAKLLDGLYYDCERYVTRSVANHLNDVSKIDPDLVVDILKKWKNSEKQNEKEMNYIISHSLRTSIKKWHKKSLEFLGYHANPKITVSDLIVNNSHITLGEYLEFSFQVSANQDENLMIDYKVIYTNLTGRYSEKVFKLSSTSLKKWETKIYTKKHMFKSMTTKKLYTWKHTLQLQINGKIFSENIFNLIM